MKGRDGKSLCPRLCTDVKHFHFMHDSTEQCRNSLCVGGLSVVNGCD